MRIRQQLIRKKIRWIVDYKDGRGKRRRKFFAARDEAVHFSNTVTEKREPAWHGASVTVGYIFNAYIGATRNRRRPRTQRNTISRFRIIRQALSSQGIHYVTQLNDLAFNRLVEALRATGRSEHTVGDYTSSYQTAIRWAEKQGLLLKSPYTDMRIPTPQKHRERHLSKEEVEAMLEHLARNALLLPAALGVYQGLRRAEVCGLRVSDVEPEANRLTVTAPKTSDWRTIQLHKAMQRYLPSPLPPRDYLCVNRHGKPWTPDNLTHRFRPAMDELGPKWADVTFHTLRHTCASQMAAYGKYTLYQIGHFLGHRSVQTTQKYAHLLPGQIKPDW